MSCKLITAISLQRVLRNTLSRNYERNQLFFFFILYTQSKDHPGVTDGSNNFGNEADKESNW